MSRIEEALEKAARLRESGGNDKPRKTAPAGEPSALPPPVENRKVENPLLVTVADPHTPIAEEYRKLKSILVKLTRQEQFLNTLMVTSSLGGEGKSITSLNLAISLAQEYDHTVLLVDADLRKPSIPGYLGLEPKLGIADCLMDGIDIGEALIKTGIGKLSLLPAGRAIRNPVEFFSSQKMKELLEEMKHRYPDRYVIVDAPPVLPFAETRSLSRLVDGVVLVVKEGAASRRNINQAMDALQGAKVLGIVYNGVSIENLDNHYRHYYHGYAKAG